MAFLDWIPLPITHAEPVPADMAMPDWVTGFSGVPTTGRRMPFKRMESAPDLGGHRASCRKCEVDRTDPGDECFEREWSRA